MADQIDSLIGRRIREARLLSEGASGGPMTQTELGELVGVSFQQVQKYESGANRISGSRLWQIARVLNRPITYFFADLSADEPAPEISDSAIATAKLFHELPEGDLKQQVFRLVKSMHATEVRSKKVG